MQSSNYSRLGAALMIASALFLWTGPTQAVDSVWQSGGGGDFNTGGNWDIGVPGPTTNALFGLSGSSYDVTFSAWTTNAAVVMTGTTQTVRFDLNGNTYRFSPVGAYNTLIYTNAGTSGTWVIEDGTIGVHADGSQYYLGAGSTLVITNGGKLLGGYILSYSTNTTLVSGPGSQMADWHGGAWTGPLIVSNGASVTLRSHELSMDTIIDGATFTNYSRFMNYGGNTTRIRNGATMISTFGGSPSTIGLQSGNDSKLIIGDAGPVSLWSADGIFYEEWYNAIRGNTDVIISTNGILRLTGQSWAPFIYYPSLVGATNFGYYYGARISDGSYMTLRGGAVALNTNGTIAVADYNLNTSGFADAGTGVLRGYGTISNYNAGANFNIVNHGVIRPGDYGYEIGAHSNIVALGAIELIGGNLVMTNPLSQVGSAIYFDFSDTALDQIKITGGAALVTGGSNIFTLAAGSAPLGPYKWGLGTYDFITGTNIVWSPEYANLTNILALAGLTEGLEYNFGVVQTGEGMFALRLQFVPEPSTVLLLLGGGLLVWRFRKRH